MSMDDLEPRPKPQSFAGFDLSRLSVDELKERIVDLQDEIVRVQATLSAKQAHLSAADKLFGKA